MFAARKPRRIFSLFLLSAVFAGGNAAVAHAQAQAQDILKKMAAVYDVSSFQATMTRSETGTTDENKPYTMSSVEEITFKRPNLYAIKNSGPGVGGTQIVVFNGKETINYISARNQYTKQPVVPGAAANQNTFLPGLLGIRFDLQSGRVVGSTTLGGKAAYVVQVAPPVAALPLNAPTKAKAQLEQLKKMLVPYELAIDKKDYHLLKVTQTTPAIKLTKTLEITRQTLNPNVADSVFVFTPPPGAKLVTRAGQDGRALIAGGMNGKSGGVGGRVSSGGGSPVPPPHASPGGNGTAHKP